MQDVRQPPAPERHSQPLPLHPVREGSVGLGAWPPHASPIDDDDARHASLARGTVAPAGGSNPKPNPKPKPKPKPEPKPEPKL